MEAFLDKYLQLANKNKNLIVSLGKKDSDNVFDNTLTEKTINKIIKYIGEAYRTKRKYYTETIYYKGNEQKKTINNELFYQLVNDLDVYMDDTCLLVNRQFITDAIIMPSYGEYDYNTKTEVLEYIIENSFMCRFKLEDDIHSLDIVVYKPCDKGIFLNFLNKIKSL